jgi:hypothetical protein
LPFVANGVRVEHSTTRGGVSGSINSEGIWSSVSISTSSMVASQYM